MVFKAGFTVHVIVLEYNCPLGLTLHLGSVHHVIVLFTVFLVIFKVVKKATV